MNPGKMTLVAVVALGLCLGITAIGQEKKKSEPKKPANVFTDPATAPIDYKIQGEYADKTAKLAAQVVARGNGKFDVYFLQGGLPGAGWDPKSKRTKVEAKLGADVATFAGSWNGSIVPGTDAHLDATDADGKSFSLKRVERSSPTLGAKPPEGAIILFDGKNADEWKGGKMTGDLLAVPASSKRAFGGNFKLHIEFRTPFQPTAGGQGRGNSGVFVLGREVQVLDSFGLEGKNNECGAIYSFRAPSVNMCLPPLVWQTYDIECKSGKVDPDSKKQAPPTITVQHNGVTVHDNVELKGAPKQANINLQNHGNPVVYRNIWVVEMK